MNMPITDDRIRTLAQEALKLASGDVAVAIRLMSEMSGLSLELAFEAVDDVVMQALAKREHRP